MIPKESFKDLIRILNETDETENSKQNYARNLLANPCMRLFVL